MPTDIRFFYDVVCPYAFMASARIEDLERATGRRVRWCPVLLGGIFRQVGAAADPLRARSVQRQRVDLRDIDRQAAHVGLALQRPSAHPRRTVSAMRLLVGCPEDLRPALSRALFAAYWQQGLDISNDDALQDLARPFGLDAKALIATDAVRDRLFAATSEAVDAGAFGVPTFQADGRVWWGVDRMGLLVEALGGSGWRVGADGPDGPAPAGAPPTVALFHDFASPFSYLAWVGLKSVVERTGGQVESVPITLGGLFRTIGTVDVPLFAMNPARQRYFLQDLADCAASAGLPFAFPAVFPQRTIDALRVALVEPALTSPIYKAVWSEGANVGDRLELGGVIERAGFDAGALFQAIESTDVKTRLRQNTDRAAAAGACGVPTFVVQGELLWGQDRLDVVERMLHGWRPPTSSQEHA